MPSIPANELKTRGVTAIEQALADSSEAIVSVRGQDKYVVMSFEQYAHLRTCELEAAIHETRKDLAEGRFVTESAADHVKRIAAMERAIGLSSQTATTRKLPSGLKSTPS
jgi:hypothetical protein